MLQDNTPYGYGPEWSVARVHPGPTFSIGGPVVAKTAEMDAHHYTYLGRFRGEHYVALYSNKPHGKKIDSLIMLYRKWDEKVFEKFVGDATAVLYRAWQLRNDHQVWIFNVDDGGG